ncbi:MAG: hypothetical protein JWR26_34 [Pedosphaera sp.]|nr:hypothetical protein [Pedosphaera sp.]
MKRIILSLSMGFFSVFGVAAQTVPVPVRLEGLIYLPGEKQVLLEVHDKGSADAEWQILEQGQVKSGIEIVEIDTDRGRVRIQRGGTNTIWAVSHEGHAGAVNDSAEHANILLENADIMQVAKLYARMKGRTVLRFPTLPRISFDLSISATNQVEAARAIEKAFEEKGIILVLDGEKFVVVAPKADAQAAAVQPPAPYDSSLAEETIPPGESSFSIDCRQMLAIYAQLVGRKVVELEELPPVEVYLQNDTPLTKSEAIHVMETLFKWNGLKMVPVGDDSIKAVSISSP